MTDWNFDDDTELPDTYLDALDTALGQLGLDSTSITESAITVAAPIGEYALSWAPIPRRFMYGPVENGLLTTPVDLHADPVDPDAVAAAFNAAIQGAMSAASNGIRHGVPWVPFDDCTCPSQACGGVADGQFSDSCSAHRSRPNLLWHWAAACGTR